MPAALTMRPFYSWILPCFLLPNSTTSQAATENINAGDFPSPGGFDRKGWCSTCSGTGANRCESPDCTQRCAQEHLQCFIPGCCCDPRLVPTSTEYNCRVTRSRNSTWCAWECCASAVHEGKTIEATRCGDGCCPPSPHGVPAKCGASLFSVNVGGKLKHLPCCLDGDASQTRQTGVRCCFHGGGVNCTSNSSCCLLASTEVDRHGKTDDPHAVCQSTPTKKHPDADYCKQFVPCPGKTGVDCSTINKRVCCLRSDEPSVHDPCQLSVQDCAPDGRYVPCSSSSTLGVDCSSKTPNSSCCMPGGRETSFCRQRDCNAYEAQQIMKQLVLVTTPLLCTSLLVLAAWRSRHRARACSSWIRRLADRSSSDILLPDGSVALASPRLDHEKRIAIIISCQTYVHYTELTNSHRDGAAVAQRFRELGYQVIHVHGTTCGRMLGAFVEAVQNLAGTTGALLVVYFAGHAVELQGSLMWAAEDACTGDASHHCNMVDLSRKLHNLHVPGEALRWFSCTSEVRRLYVVFMADCCRTPFDGEGTLDRFVNLCEVPAVRRRARDRACLCFIYACDPGLSASDGVGEHSPFARQVLKQLSVPQSVITFSEHVAIGLSEMTSGRQRLWRREVCGADFQRVSLASLPEYLREVPH